MRACTSAGFTLLEILVTLAVFGFLLVGLNQTVWFGLTAWRHQALLSAGETDLEAVERSLRSIIQNLAPDEDAAGSALVGTADTLSGVTMLRLPGAGAMPTRVEVGLALSGAKLVLRWRPYHHGEALRAPSPPQDAELIGGVSGLGIAYWRPSGVWSSTWTDPDLPLLIRVRLTFARSDAMRWPDIVVAPLLSRP